MRERYGNLFEMYERITGENPYRTPMRIYPASHYTMGGLWVDYELMTTIPGLYCAGEANFSDHGANRLGASALMQGLADGYFVLPYTMGNYLAPMLNKPIPGTDHDAFKAAEAQARERFAHYLEIGGTRSPDYFHRELGKIIWDYCGMDRNESGLEKALSEIPALYDEFQQDLRVTGLGTQVNQTLEKAGRVDDFFQLGMLDVPRRAGAPGELRRALPLRVPDGGGRGAARRRALRPRRGVGVDGRPDGGQAPPRGARVRDRPLPDPFVQVSDEPMTRRPPDR